MMICPPSHQGNSSIHCLVLGGGGFMGSHLCEKLVQIGHPVRVFERHRFNRTNIESLNGKIDVREGDFQNPNDVAKSLADVDCVFHLICTTIPGESNRDPVRDVSDNLIATIHLLESARKCGVKRVIFFSSGGTVYGPLGNGPIAEESPTEPICSYGIQKLAIEKYLRLFHHLYGMDYKILRISNTYGARQSGERGQGIVAALIRAATGDSPIDIWGDGSVVRDYIHVSDVVSAALATMRHDGAHTLFNIGSGMGTSLTDLIQRVETVAGCKILTRFHRSRPLDVPVNILNIARATRELAWTPRIQLDEGLAMTLSQNAK